MANSSSKFLILLALFLNCSCGDDKEDGDVDSSSEPSSCNYNEDLLISNAEDVKMLESFECDTIIGDVLIVLKDDTKAITGIGKLREIKGDVKLGIGSNGLFNRSLSDIIGFESLEKIIGRISFSQVPNLTKLNGFNNLKLVSGISILHRPSEGYFIGFDCDEAERLADAIGEGFKNEVLCDYE